MRLEVFSCTRRFVKFIVKIIVSDTTYLSLEWPSDTYLCRPENVRLPCQGFIDSKIEFPLLYVSFTDSPSLLTVLTIIIGFVCPHVLRMADVFRFSQQTCGCLLLVHTYDLMSLLLTICSPCPPCSCKYHQ